MTNETEDSTEGRAAAASGAIEATRFRAFRLHKSATAPEGRVVEMTVADLSPGDVVIRVAYSSINYKDALAASGQNAIVKHYPRIGGIDLSGTVAASSDARFAPGDEVVVHGFGIGVDHDGGHAGYARVAGDWVMPLPAGLSLFEAGVLGAAGYTAALSLHLMELNGLEPGRGPVLVTGATGGVASLAIDMLATRGYSVTALTGKKDSADALLALGAERVLFRGDIEMGTRPLEKGQWAGAVDSLGGATLGWVTRTMQNEGVITAFGNASGPELPTTVLPFILRGVRLIGINANSAMPLRKVVWGKIAGAYRPRRLDAIASLITLEDLPERYAQMLDAKSRGRMVIRMKAVGVQP